MGCTGCFYAPGSQVKSRLYIVLYKIQMILELLFSDNRKMMHYGSCSVNAVQY